MTIQYDREYINITPFTQPGGFNHSGRADHPAEKVIGDENLYL